MAHRLLATPKLLKGPKRAVVAAIALYHEGKAKVSARLINEKNDKSKTEYISNISTAVAAAVKDGWLEEISGSWTTK